MPEGHTIHRHARLHGERFTGRPIAVTSPQGRFAAGAARLDGRTLETATAAGKHLFYGWEGGETLHVHLGLVGKFRTFVDDPPPPTPGTRMAWTSDNGTLYLAGPMVCELITPDEEDRIRSTIGPDPLGGGIGTDFVARLRTRSIPIGAALLDQKTLAGIGNVYRAELLFLAGIHPATPARELDDAAAEGLWNLAVRHLRAGERAGRIITVDPSEVGARSRRDLARGERLYVYKRDGEECRRCGAEILRTELAGRWIWWCPACQPS